MDPGIAREGAMRVFFLSVALLTAAASVCAQPAGGEAEQGPFGTVERALQLRNGMSESELAAYIGKRIKTPEPQSANDLLLTAELLQQAGDYRAEEYYEKTIAANAAEPAFELFYADYLRNFRGPLRPLFEEAERHYFSAIEKLRRRPDGTVRDRVERGLVALYQEDGIPFAWRRAAPDLYAPVAFFRPALRAARSTADLDEVHDARDFTAEALFAASASRLNRPLTLDELRGLVRRKEPQETVNRLRFRVHDSAIDVVYARRLIENAQVTDFYVPDHFNRVALSAIGITAVQVVALPAICDAALKVGWQEQDRRGLVEFLPQTLEKVGQGQAELTLSRFFGPDKADLTLAYVAQDIDQQLPQPPRRDRHIASARLAYDVLRPLTATGNPYRDRFVTRGLQLYGGIVDDREHFGAVEVRRRDYLLGASLRGVRRFDVTLQPTLFTVDVGQDRSQSTSQLRVETSTVYRIVDEEEQPGIPPSSLLGLHLAFLHLVAALKHDAGLEGLSAFENDRIGLGLETKLFVRGFADPAARGALRFRGTTFLAALHVARERFPRLRKDANILDLSVGAGF
jgi:hypothetical protein